MQHLIRISLKRFLHDLHFFPELIKSRVEIYSDAKKFQWKKFRRKNFVEKISVEKISVEKISVEKISVEKDSESKKIQSRERFRVKKIQS